MKHQAIPIIRGLLITLDRSSDPDEILWVIGEIVKQLRELAKAVRSLKQQNKAGSQSPG
jgi:hypothetical protein